MQVRSLKVLAWPVLIAGQLSCSTGALAASLESLRSACGDGQQASFDESFQGVHDAFHALIAHLPGGGH